MVIFAIAAGFAFKWMYDKGIFDGSAAPARPGLAGQKPRRIARRAAPPPPPAPETVNGTGEDWVDPADMVTPEKLRKAPPAHAAAQDDPEEPPRTRRRDDGAPRPAPKAQAKPDGKAPLPPRPAGKGSFDDVMETLDSIDSLDGVGVDEVEELNGVDRPEGDDEEA